MLLAALLCLTPLAHAQTVSKEEAGRSLKAIQAAFEDAERKEKIWRWSWAGFYAASMAGNLAYAEYTDSHDGRYDAHVSATTSALGLIGMILEPSIYKDNLRSVTLKARRPKASNLKKAEGMLIESGRTEALYASTHRKKGLAVSFAAGLVIALDDGRPEDGAIQFVTGALVNELKLRTHPHTLTRFWRDYSPRTIEPFLSQLDWNVLPHYGEEGLDGGRLVARFEF
ncbi:MAG: hypothetical protein D6758_08590 [Gammaproteobacteria bacterium]|nr:MAG: hypothetical protein D6758_08590 [Gammaproteobacteria bacterium]